MNKKKYLQIKEKYPLDASWAIWDETNIENVSIIEKHLPDLNPHIVLVGLNPARKEDIDQPWKNFHVGRNDYRLMRAFNHSYFRGAYMTDFVKGVHTPQANDIRRELTGDRLAHHLNEFRKELELLGNKNYFILLFTMNNDIIEPFKEMFSDEVHGKVVVNFHSFTYRFMAPEEWQRRAKQVMQIYAKRGGEY